MDENGEMDGQDIVQKTKERVEKLEAILADHDKFKAELKRLKAGLKAMGVGAKKGKGKTVQVAPHERSKPGRSKKTAPEGAELPQGDTTGQGVPETRPTRRCDIEDRYVLVARCESGDCTKVDCLHYGEGNKAA